MLKADKKGFKVKLDFYDGLQVSSLYGDPLMINIEVDLLSLLENKA